MSKFRVVDLDDPIMVIHETDDFDTGLVTMIARLIQKYQLVNKYTTNIPSDMLSTVYLMLLNNNSLLNRYYYQGTIYS